MTPSLVIHRCLVQHPQALHLHWHCCPPFLGSTSARPQEDRCPSRSRKQLLKQRGESYNEAQNTIGAETAIVMSPIGGLICLVCGCICHTAECISGQKRHMALCRIYVDPSNSHFLLSRASLFTSLGHCFFFLRILLHT